MKLPPASTILSRPLFLLSAFALVASLLLPVHGLGLPACGFQAALQRPCFGCGMTRAVTALSHLEPEIAWHYHPFSFLLWPLMVVFGLAGILPPFGRVLTEKVIRRLDRPLTVVFWSAVFLFFGYGFWRMFAQPQWPF